MRFLTQRFFAQWFLAQWTSRFAVVLAIASLSPAIGHAQTLLGISRTSTDNPGYATQCQVGVNPSTQDPTFNMTSKSKAWYFNMFAMPVYVEDYDNGGMPGSVTDDDYAALADSADSHATASRGGGVTAEGIGEATSNAAALISQAINATSYGPTLSTSMVYEIQNSAKYADVTSTVATGGSRTDSVFRIIDGTVDSVLYGEMHLEGSVQKSGPMDYSPTSFPEEGLYAYIDDGSVGATHTSTGWVFGGALPTGSYTVINQLTGQPVDLSPYTEMIGGYDVFDVSTFDDEINITFSFWIEGPGPTVEAGSSCTAYSALTANNASSGTVMTNTLLYSGAASANFYVEE